jgi:hypothetical protein
MRRYDKDYGEAEIWTNSRLMRACPNAIAKYQAGLRVVITSLITSLIRYFQNFNRPLSR